MTASDCVSAKAADCLLDLGCATDAINNVSHHFCAADESLQSCLKIRKATLSFT